MNSSRVNPGEKSSPEREQATRRVRIQDVAKQCGLSITTVSQALNLRSDECRVSSETRTLVQRVANELGYRPSRLARGLAKGRTFTVGILAYSMAPTGIYAEMIGVISQVLESSGYHLILTPVSDRIDQWAQTLLDEQVDGCIVLNNVTPELRAVLGKTRLPIVLVNVESDLPVQQVLVDDAAGMRELTEHLLSIGHRRVTYLIDNPSEARLPKNLQHYSLREREQAFRDTMAAAGATETATVASMPASEYADQLITMPRDQRPTAVICFWHRLAMHLMRLLWERGLNVPADLSVAAFNDVEFVADAIPPLTTVAIPNLEMGRRAAMMLKEQIESTPRGGRHPTEPEDGDSALADRTPQRLFLTPHLVVRRSTAPPRASA